VVGALLRGLRELGYVYGKHFVTEPRGGGSRPELFPSLAAELVRLKVDVIVAGGGRALPALKQATSTIPIIMGIIYFTPALILNGIFIVHNVLYSLCYLCQDAVVGSTT
jgi:hypothetical protein